MSRVRVRMDEIKSGDVFPGGGTASRDSERMPSGQVWVYVRLADGSESIMTAWPYNLIDVDRESVR